MGYIIELLSTIKINFDIKYIIIKLKLDKENPNKAIKEIPTKSC